MSAAKAELPVCMPSAASKQTSVRMALIRGIVVSNAEAKLVAEGWGRNAHRGFVTRALSPYAELSGPAADHSRDVEDARGGARRFEERARQQRDVFLDAGSRRHA